MGLLDKLKARRGLLTDREKVEQARREQEQKVAVHLLEREAERVEVVKPVVEKPAAQLLVDKIRARMNLALATNNPKGYAEVQRICEQAICTPLTSEEVDAVSRQELDAAAYARGDRLFPPQAAGIIAFDEVGGLFADVGVGFGKTGLCLLCALHAYRKGLRRVLLLVPKPAYIQLTQSDLQWWATRISLGIPVIKMGDLSQSKRLEIAHSGKKGLYILPYSCLSTKDTSEVIDTIRPELIVADEAHNLSNPRSARTKRLMDYCEEHSPQLVVLSGTMTRKRVIEYHHLIKHSLKARMPLPLSPVLAGEWGGMIDTDAKPTEGQTGPIRPLVEWAQQHWPAGFESKDADGKTRLVPWTYDVAGFRHAYQQRRNTSLGVVSTGDNEIGCSLILANSKVKDREKSPGWPALAEHFRRLNELWLTPNGDEIEHAIHTWKWANELSAGFYNELTWPTPEVLAERRRVSVAEATDLLDRAKEQHALAQIYAKKLRKWLEVHARPGLDTPFLVGSSMHTYGAKHVGSDLYDSWIDERGAVFEGMPTRDKRAVRVCPYKIDHAVRWASCLPKDEGALLWVSNIEVGVWLHEELSRVLGEDRTLHCPAGSRSNERLNYDLHPESTKKLVVCSLEAHGESKNLQKFFNQCFLQWPRSCRDAEQGLGRTHRSGQTESALIAWTFNTLEFDELNFAACLNDALYVAQSTGNRQKIVYATYDPMPKIFPSEVLRERGFENMQLDQATRKIMVEKFGNMLAHGSLTE